MNQTESKDLGYITRMEILAEITGAMVEYKRTRNLVPLMKVTDNSKYHTHEITGDGIRAAVKEGAECIKQGLLDCYREKTYTAEAYKKNVHRRLHSASHKITVDPVDVSVEVIDQYGDPWEGRVELDFEALDRVLEYLIQDRNATESLAAQMMAAHPEINFPNLTPWQGGLPRLALAKPAALQLDIPEIKRPMAPAELAMFMSREPEDYVREYMERVNTDAGASDGFGGLPFYKRTEIEVKAAGETDWTLRATNLQNAVTPALEQAWSSEKPDELMAAKSALGDAKEAIKKELSELEHAVRVLKQAGMPDPEATASRIKETLRAAEAAEQRLKKKEEEAEPEADSVSPVDEVSDTGSREKSYLEKSLNQVVLGRYTDDVTLLGTVGQIGLGLTGLDLPADVRDLVYDFTYWEPTWEHAGQTLLDGVGLLPGIGALKNADEVNTLVKGAAKYADELTGTVKGIFKNGEELLQSAGKHVDDIALDSQKALRERVLKNIEESRQAREASNFMAYARKEKEFLERLAQDGGEEINPAGQKYIDKSLEVQNKYIDNGADSMNRAVEGAGKKLKVIDGKVGGKISVEDYNAIRQSSIKNPNADSMTLGKYTNDSSSYITIARHCRWESFNNRLLSKLDYSAKF